MSASKNSRTRAGQESAKLADNSRTQASQSRSTIADCVELSVNRFLADLNGEEVNDIYDMVLHQVEKPLLEVVMKHTEDNQSKASRMLGINRNTLRKKLADHNIAPSDKAGT